MGARLRQIYFLWKAICYILSIETCFRDARPSLPDRFRFDPDAYPARRRFPGRWSFGTHGYPLPGELDDDLAAVETACAIAIVGMAEVKSRVRDLERRLGSSFWLPIEAQIREAIA